MQSYSQAFHNAISATDRDIRGYIKFNGTFVLDGEGGLISFKTTQTAMEAERFCVGSVCSAMCEANFFNEGLTGSGVSLANSYFDAYVGVVTDADSATTEYVCVGRYYISEITRSTATTRIVGYDIAGRLSMDYAPTVTAGSNGYLAMDILNDIIDQTGVNGGQHFTTYGSTTYVPTLFEGTCRAQWGWLCSLIDGTASNYSGSREESTLGYMKGYVVGNSAANPYAIDDNTTYIDGLSVGDEFTITSFTSGTTEEPIVVGNGTGVYGLNPYMTQAVATTIEGTVDGYDYYPVTLHWRGDPCLDLMDELSVTSGENTYNVVVMKIETTFNGGLEQTISCWGDSEEYYAMSTSPTQGQINRVSSLVQEIQQAIETADGGVITKILDTDGTWKELVIANNQDLDQATSVWRFNINGLAHSNRYQGGTYTLAMDTQGRIVANVIQTGILQDAAGKNSWNLDTGAFTITEGSIRISTTSATQDSIRLIFAYPSGDTTITSMFPSGIDVQRVEQGETEIGNGRKVSISSNAVVVGYNTFENGGVWYGEPITRLTQNGLSFMRFDNSTTPPSSSKWFEVYSNIINLYDDSGTLRQTVTGNGLTRQFDANGTLRQQLNGDGKLWQYDANGKQRTYLEYGDIFLYTAPETQTLKLSGAAFPTLGGSVQLYDTSAVERVRLTAEGLIFYNSSGAQTAIYPATGTWSMVGNKTGATNSLTGLTINLGVVTASDMGIANNASAAVVAGGWLSYCTAKYPNAKQCIFEGVALANSYRMMRCMIYDTADKSGIQPNVATGQMQFYDGATTLFGTQNYNVWTRDVTMSARVYA